MNDQQRAAMIRPRGKSEAPHMIAAYRAMQQASDYLTDLGLGKTQAARDLRKALENNELSDVTLINEGDMAHPQDHSEQHLNMVQGEPVAWMDSDGFAWTKEGVECRTTPDTYTPLYTTPPVVPQEPVAWMCFDSNGDALFCHPIADGAVPLYTTPPSVEAAIEATKEKAAKVCEELQEVWLEEPVGKRPGYDCAAAIRSMK